MKRTHTHLFGMALAAIALSTVACGAAPDEQEEATEALESEPASIPPAVAPCDTGSFSLLRLQRGPNAGPASFSTVKCVGDYQLCRVDPTGLDRKACANAQDCYACALTLPQVRSGDAGPGPIVDAAEAGSLSDAGDASDAGEEPEEEEL